MSSQILETLSEEETQNFAIQCADEAVKGDIFLINGPLGAGKSVFCRSFIHHLVDKDIDVPSPTFTLVQTYDAPKSTIWHFDLYRLESPEEIYELGWEDALQDNILLIEWPERLENLKPAHYKEIIIEPIDDESRKITLNIKKEI